MRGRKKPKLLDLFCGAGGAGMGYARAGFDVIGVDVATQVNYPFAFVRGCAIAFVKRYGGDFDLIHASPPCQAFSVAKNIHNGSGRHPDLIAPTRNALVRTGATWVIENVVGSPLRSPVTICGLWLKLNVRRHRLFESSAALVGTPCGDHTANYHIVFGGGAKGRAHTIGKAKGGASRIYRPFVSHADASISMGIDWMKRDELSQAVPPAYTEYLGRQLLRLI
jgi:DNA (cytosine-5)-methyltransferase 1